MLFDVLRADLRFGIKQLRKSPAFTLAATLTLALGIGANATIFSWLNSVVLNPLPAVDATGLMSVRWHTQEGNSISFSWPDYLDTRQRSKSLAGLSVGSMNAFSLGEGSHPERIWGMLVSSDYFRTLGVRPAAGRYFQPQEDREPGGHPVAVISHHLWQTRFGGDAAMVGRQIRLNNRSFTVIGIAPEGFQGSVLGLAFELYLPATMREAMLGGAPGGLMQRGNHWLGGHARLLAGVDRRKAEAELNAISAQLAREFSRADDYPRAELVPIWRDGGGQMLAPVILLMMAVVAVVLLIACANVANLLLARGAGRRREIAIRQALGVSRGRLVGQLLVENSLLALLGCGGALLMLPWAGGLLMGFAPVSDYPVSVQVRNDWPVFAFTLGISVAATLLFGLLPALRASRFDVADSLKDSGGGSAGPSRTWLRNSLVVAQVALSMVLLVGAGLLLKSLGRAAASNPGFDARNVLVAGVDLFPNGCDAARGQVALRQMLERIAAVPGVAAVSTVRRVPLGLGGSSTTFIEVEGYANSKKEEMMSMVQTVGPDYFHTMHTALMAGREFTPADTETTQNVVLINETFAKRYFANADPLGRRVKCYGEMMVVAGVARDSKFRSLDEKPGPVIYRPVFQAFSSESNFLVRTLGEPMRSARAVEAAIHAVDPTVPVYGERTLETSISTAYFGQRMGGSLLGVFGGLALLLAAIGLYGVLAYSVTQRSREVGIRVAMGATQSDVLRLILLQGLRLAAIGLAVGLLVALPLTRFMTSLLFGVSPTDLPTIVCVASVLAAVTLAASFIPAWRATRIDAILAIRQD